MISINDQRVLFWDNSASSFSDLTKELNDNLVGTSALTIDTNDAIYIGSFLPFSNLFMGVESANAVSSNLLFEYWDGSTWRSVVDTIDFTQSSGATLSSSGVVHIFPDDQYTWSYVERTTDVADLTEFAAGPEIYKKYWTRIRTSAVITVTLNYIGTLFCDENELITTYPQFNSSTLKNSWAVGKTDWLDQRIMASEYVVLELKKRDLIADRSQIIETSIYKPAAIHKTAEIIFNGLGARNYAAEIVAAKERLKDSMNLNHSEIDVNANAIKERAEQTISIRRGTR